jgi:lipid-binding SYLF domain-containing protein
LVGQEGKGVLVEHASGKRTYLMTLRAGTGPGLGYQSIARILAFKSQVALDQFTVAGKGGVDFGVQETLGTYNAEQSVNPMLKFWDINEKGLAIQFYWGASTYVVDPKLNDPSTF